MATEDEVRDRVQHYLTKHFRVGLERGGGFSIDHESTRGFISVRGKDDRVIVTVEAVVAFNVPESPQMLEHVAKESDSYLFGHLAIREDQGRARPLPGRFHPRAPGQLPRRGRAHQRRDSRRRDRQPDRRRASSRSSVGRRSTAADLPVG